MGIKQLADDLIPADVYTATSTMRRVLAHYSPYPTIYLIAQQRLFADAKLIEVLRIANWQREKGQTVNSWKVDYDTNGGNEGQIISGQKLVKLYDFYRDATRNLEGTRTYNYSVGLTYLINNWRLIGAKSF